MIGMRGAGKTTVGRVLASDLRLGFLDLDEEIARMAGLPITEIFARQGEARFRELESAAIARCGLLRNHVIAVGGGAVMSEQNRAQLRAAGLCIWITAGAEALIERLTRDAASAPRPPLTNLSFADEVRAVLHARTPLYSATAHVAVATDQRAPAEVAAAIRSLDAFQLWQKAGNAALRD